MNFTEEEIYKTLVDCEFCEREDLGDFIKNGLNASISDLLELDNHFKAENFKSLFNALNRYSNNYQTTLPYDKLSLCNALQRSARHENYEILIDLLTGKDSSTIYELAAKKRGKSPDDMTGFEVINEIIKDVDSFMLISPDAMTSIGNYLRAEDAINEAILKVQQDNDLFDVLSICVVEQTLVPIREKTPEEYNEEFFEGKLQTENPDLWKKITDSYEEGNESDVYIANVYSISKEVLEKHLKKNESIKDILIEYGNCYDFGKEEYLFDKASLKEFGNRSNAEIIVYQAPEILGEDLSIDYSTDYRLPLMANSATYRR